MRTKILSLDSFRDTVADPADRTAPDNRRELHFSRRLLRTAMERELTDRQRQCVELYYFQGRTEAETGRALGIGKATVCRHLQHARRRLKKAADYGVMGMKAAREEEM